jgi:type IV fimbrial biogenesis protein FimT
MLSISQQRGVTLIELMIGIVIVAILSALAAPSYRGWIQNQQIRTAAESILNGVQLARNEAVKNNSRARFVMCGLPVSSWEVLAVSAPAVAPTQSLACGAGSNAAAGEVRVQERSGQEGSRLATVTVFPNTATTVTFNSFGRVVANADGTVPLAQFDISTPTGDRPLRVLLGTGGNTRMCDPSPLLPANDPRRCTP